MAMIAELEIVVEISHSVFSANTNAFDDSPLIRVNNTTSKMKKISNEIGHIKDISSFNIYTINREKSDSDRTQRVLEILKPNMPKQFMNELTDLCSEFADIFALDDDKMSTTHIYTQTLRTTDAEPKYLRNYRLPKCHKD